MSPPPPAPYVYRVAGDSGQEMISDTEAQTQQSVTATLVGKEQRSSAPAFRAAKTFLCLDPPSTLY